MKQLMIIFYLLATLGNNAAASPKQQIDVFPINIHCQSEDGTQTQLKIGLSPLKNLATLDYVNADPKKSIHIGISDIYGIYSSSTVAINANAEDEWFGVDTLTISAAMEEVFRVTRINKFSMSFTQNKAGMYQPAKLSYEQGIDAFPEDYEKNEVDVSKLICSITGL